jgi:hypothetical protein
MNAATQLQESGWSLSSHGLPPEVLSLLVERKNEYLQTAIREVKSASGVTFDRFDSDKTEHIELAKAITRSLLRYDACSFELAKAVLKKLRTEYGLAAELNFVTLPYPIIHFSYDTSEIGPKHKDGYDYIDHFYTTWTPLNDCFHKPVSITEKTHTRDNFFLRQLRSRIKFIDRKIIASKKVIYPDLELGKFLLWHGTTDHEGLLNTTENITTTLVIRFTSSPILYDIALSCDELEKAGISEDAIDTVYFTKKLIGLFEEIDEWTKENSHERVSFDAMLEKINHKIISWGLSKAEWKRFSFALGLWAQRLEAKREVFLFYLFAFLGAHDNFYVLHKCITSVFRFYGKDAARKFIQVIIEKYPCRQVNHVVKSALLQQGENAGSLRLVLPEAPDFLTYDFG